MMLVRKRDYMSPLNKLRWQKAVRAKAKKVELDDGRVFIIRYEKFSSKVTDETWDVIHFRGPDVQDASGYLRLSHILREEWLTESEHGPKTMDSLYMQYVEKFLKSEPGGVDIKKEWPELKHRTTETLRRGFNNAIQNVGKRAKKLVVITRGETVFLLKDGHDD